jgi:hypothetical protein
MAWEYNTRQPKRLITKPGPQQGQRGPFLADPPQLRVQVSHADQQHVRSYTQAVTTELAGLRA